MTDLRDELQATLSGRYTLERELQPKVAEVRRRLARLGGIEGR